jgi:hypothetical protein
VRLLTGPGLRVSVAADAASSELMAEKPNNAERIQIQEVSSISHNASSEVVNLSHSPVSLLFRSRVDAISSSSTLPAGTVDSTDIAEVLNHNSTTSLGGNRSWEVEETPRGYVLYCCFEAELGSAIDRQQVYADAEARIAEILPQDATVGEEKNGESFIENASDQSVRVVVAELDQHGWEDFCRQLRASERVSSRPV